VKLSQLASMNAHIHISVISLINNYNLQLPRLYYKTVSVHFFGMVSGTLYMINNVNLL